jgi:HEAT repeat protein
MNTTRAEEDARIVSRLNERGGVAIKSVFDLVNTKNSYAAAIPVLLDCLPEVQDKWIKEGVVRALSVKEARGTAEPALVREFEAITPDDRERQSLKWAIGNALSTVATDAVADQLIRIAQDKRHGKAREMIVVALANLRDAQVVDTLIALLADDEVCGYAAIALGKLKSKRAVDPLQCLLQHSQPWVRKEVEKALGKIGR